MEPLKGVPFGVAPPIEAPAPTAPPTPFRSRRPARRAGDLVALLGPMKHNHVSGYLI